MLKGKSYLSFNYLIILIGNLITLKLSIIGWLSFISLDLKR